MQLNEVNINNATKLSIVNDFLSENFKIRINEESSISELVELHKTIAENNVYLRKEKGLTPKDSEYTKSLSMLKAIELILESKTKVIHEDIDMFSDNVRDQVVDKFYPIIGYWFPKGVTLDSCIEMAMREYRSSPYVLDDNEVENDLRDKWKQEFPNSCPEHNRNDVVITTSGELDEIKRSDLFPDEEEVPVVHPGGIPTLVPSYAERLKAQLKADGKTKMNREPQNPFAPRKHVPAGSMAGRVKQLLNNDEEAEVLHYVSVDPRTISTNTMGNKGNAVVQLKDSPESEFSNKYRVRFKILPDSVEIVRITSYVGSYTDVTLNPEDMIAMCNDISNYILGDE